MRTPRGALPCDWRFGTSVALLVVAMACGGGVERPPAPEDGSLAMSLLGEPGSVYWSLSGDHIALVPWRRETRRVTLDVERGPRPETSRPFREIATSGGTTFGDHAEQSAISGGTVSSDGRWIVFIAKGATDPLDPFSTTGGGKGRPLDGRASSRDADSGRRARSGAGTSERAALARERSGPS